MSTRTEGNAHMGFSYIGEKSQHKLNKVAPRVELITKLVRYDWSVLCEACARCSLNSKEHAALQGIES